MEICCGADVKPKPESRKVFLIGDCSIQANNELTYGVKVKGCPPSVRDTYITFTKHTLDKRRAVRVVAVRLLKGIASKLGFYSEYFPAYGRYLPPEFDRKHY